MPLFVAICGLGQFFSSSHLTDYISPLPPQHCFLLAGRQSFWRRWIHTSQQIMCGGVWVNLLQNVYHPLRWEELVQPDSLAAVNSGIISLCEMAKRFHRKETTSQAPILSCCTLQHTFWSAEEGGGRGFWRLNLNGSWKCADDYREKGDGEDGLSWWSQPSTV